MRRVLPALGLCIIPAGAGPRLPPPLGAARHPQGQLSFNPPSGLVHKEGMRQTPVTEGLQMKLTAPIFRLKREAKLLARAESLKLHEAQARIA